MNIVGTLIWFDESPSWLAAAVAGFGRVCDTIVAVDGAYALFPNGRASSRPDQAEAILMAGEAAGCGVIVHRPKDIWWGNEVEKRNHALRLAGTLNPDWVLVFDADLHVMQARVGQIRDELENTTLNVASYTVLDGKDLQADEFMAEYARRRTVDCEWTIRHRGLFRWTDDLAYDGCHWMVRGTYDGETRWIYGPELIAGTSIPVEEAFELGDALVAHHRTQHRSRRRLDDAQQYYTNRDAARIESFPRPVAA